MSSNPYEAPKAPLSDYVQPDADGGFHAEPRACDASAGARWWSESWSLFTQGAGAWLLITLVWVLIAFAISAIPMGGIAVNLLYPVAVAGIMLGCDAMRRGEPLNVGHLFAGFSAPNMGQLVLIGAMSLVGGIAILLVVVVVFLVFGGLPVIQAMFQGAPPDFARMLLPILLAFLLYFALLVPLMMLTWFAPALVVLNKVPAFEAMKLSFSACLKNFMPYLVYGLIGVLVAIAASIPLFLGWFVVAPMILASLYASYREIFYSD